MIPQNLIFYEILIRISDKMVLFHGCEIIWFGKLDVFIVFDIGAN